MAVRVFFTSLSGSPIVKKQQNDIICLLSAKSIDFERVDLSEPNNEETKNGIYEKIKALQKSTVPPHLFSGDEYLGGFDDFQNAVEMEELESFLRLPGDKPRSFVSLIKDDSSEEESSASSDVGEEDSTELPSEEEKKSVDSGDAGSDVQKRKGSEDQHAEQNRADAKKKKTTECSEEDDVGEVSSKADAEAGVGAEVSMGESGDNPGMDESSVVKSTESNVQSSDKSSTDNSDKSSASDSEVSDNHSDDSKEAKQVEILKDALKPNSRAEKESSDEESDSSSEETDSESD